MNPRTVLVAEDDDALREAVSLLLKEEGWKVVEASTGLEALSILTRSAPPDLILSDHWMPGLQGDELHARLAMDPILSTVPFVLMTAHGDRDPVPPNVHILPKPFDARELMLKLEGLVSLPAEPPLDALRRQRIA